ncbi:hypothetical protein PMAYCL1PPCAC_04257, partial [Pristionchus mayeri]
EASTTEQQNTTLLTGPTGVINTEAFINITSDASIISTTIPIKQSHEEPSITFSLYVGDIDGFDNSEQPRRKRDTEGSDECILLKGVIKTVSDTLLNLSQQGKVKKVRFITYSAEANVTDAMTLEEGMEALINITMEADGETPMQSSSVNLFNATKKSNEDLVHYMPCSTDYDGYAYDVAVTGAILQEINQDRTDNTVTLISRTLNETEMQEYFGLEQSDVNIIDKDVPTDYIANNVTEIIDSNIVVATTVILQTTTEFASSATSDFEFTSLQSTQSSREGTSLDLSTEESSEIPISSSASTEEPSTKSAGLTTHARGHTTDYSLSSEQNTEFVSIATSNIDMSTHSQTAEGPHVTITSIDESSSKHPVTNETSIATTETGHVFAGSTESSTIAHSIDPFNGSSHSTTEAVSTPAPFLSILFINDFTSSLIPDDESETNVNPKVPEYFTCPGGAPLLAEQESDFTVSVINGINDELAPVIYYYAYNGNRANEIPTTADSKNNLDNAKADFRNNVCFDDRQPSDDDSLSSNIEDFTASVKSIDVLVWFTAVNHTEESKLAITQPAHIIAIGINGADVSTAYPNSYLNIDNFDINSDNVKIIDCMIEGLFTGATDDDDVVTLCNSGVGSPRSMIHKTHPNSNLHRPSRLWSL